MILTKENLIKNELLINKFMDIKTFIYPNGFPYIYEPNSFLGYTQSEYYRNWCYLMYVVHKIEEIVFPLKDSHWKDQFNGFVNSDIQVTYEVVIEFIKWYNLNK